MLRTRRAGRLRQSLRPRRGVAAMPAWERHALRGIAEERRIEELLRELLFIASCLPSAERIRAARVGARVFVGAVQFLRNHEAHLADRRLS